MQINSAGFDGEEAREFNWLALVAGRISIPVSTVQRLTSEAVADFN